MDDRSCYEKLSIRESARALKKYGSTSKHVMKNENYIKHFVSSTDTLQGIALKYGVSMEQIRRANRLYASDSLFLREHLLIPVPADNQNLASPTTPDLVNTPSSSQTSSQVTSPTSYDNENIAEFLVKIDASIANTKEEVKKTQGNSEFVSSLDYNSERRKPAVSRMKQMVNNNSTDLLNTPHAVVMTQGSRVRTSLQRHEKQQDELFEL